MTVPDIKINLFYGDGWQGHEKGTVMTQKDSEIYKDVIRQRTQQWDLESLNPQPLYRAKASLRPHCVVWVAPVSKPADAEQRSQSRLPDQIELDRYLLKGRKPTTGQPRLPPRLCLKRLFLPCLARTAKKRYQNQRDQWIKLHQKDYLFKPDITIVSQEGRTIGTIHATNPGSGYIISMNNLETYFDTERPNHDNHRKWRFWSVTGPSAPGPWKWKRSDIFGWNLKPEGPWEWKRSDVSK